MRLLWWWCLFHLLPWLCLFVAPAPAVVCAAPAPVVEFVTTPAASFAAPALVDMFVAPAPTVAHAAPAHMVETVVPALAVTNAAPAPVDPLDDPVPAVTYAALAPVNDVVLPAPAVYHAALAPVDERSAPKPSATCATTAPFITLTPLEHVMMSSASAAERVRPRRDLLEASARHAQLRSFWRKRPRRPHPVLPTRLSQKKTRRGMHRNGRGRLRRVPRLPFHSRCSQRAR